MKRGESERVRNERAFRVLRAAIKAQGHDPELVIQCLLGEVQNPEDPELFDSGSGHHIGVLAERTLQKQEEARSRKKNQPAD